jgi:hypothetical protein
MNGRLDVDAFVKYLNDIKGEGEGTNVDNWQMNELVQVSSALIDTPGGR